MSIQDPNTTRVKTDHTNGRLVATFPLNGIPSEAYRIYIEEADTYVNQTDEDRFVAIDHSGARLGFRGGSWFPTMESAVARVMHSTGWGDRLEDALRQSTAVEATPARPQPSPCEYSSSPWD